MDVALIIPNYNNEKYLEKCLKSVINQSRLPDEVIIVDDCSSDSSRNIIDEYCNQYSFFRKMYNEINQGVSITRHKGILASDSEYITTLDADDYYLNTKKIENEVNLINKISKKGKDNIIAYSNITSVNDSGEKLKTEFNNFNSKEGNIYENILLRSMPIPRDFIFPKRIYMDLGGFSDIPLFEDWDLKIKLAKKCKFYYTNELGVAYRQHSSGLSSQSKSKVLFWLLKVFFQNITSVELHKKIRLTKIFIFNFIKTNLINK
jgi:glycosyltransferase involved in cell wall biosynthesis